MAIQEMHFTSNCNYHSVHFFTALLQSIIHMLLKLIYSCTHFLTLNNRCYGCYYVKILLTLYSLNFTLIYSQLTLRQTLSGPAPAVRLRESDTARDTGNSLRSQVRLNALKQKDFPNSNYWFSLTGRKNVTPKLLSPKNLEN